MVDPFVIVGIFYLQTYQMTSENYYGGSEYTFTIKIYKQMISQYNYIDKLM